MATIVYSFPERRRAQCVECKADRTFYSTGMLATAGGVFLPDQGLYRCHLGHVQIFRGDPVDVTTGKPVKAPAAQPGGSQ